MPTVNGAIDPAFRALLDAKSWPLLQQEEGSVYGIWQDFSLAYCNPGWFRFAAGQQGEPDISQHWGLGANIIDAIHPALQDFYIAAYHRCLLERRAWQHDYECSTATHYRKFRQQVYPLGEAEQRGLLIVNALFVEREHTIGQGGPPPFLDDYRDDAGMIYQCMHCRRTQHRHDKARWDFVPEWVEHMPESTSHGLCPACFQYYYVTLKGEFEDQQGIPARG